MSNRIPPSLNWLIDKRARLAGEIARTKRSLENSNSLIKELESLEDTLLAIDKTLKLHDIQINVNFIKPIASKYVRIKLDHGQLSRSIIDCLRIYGEEGPVSKIQILEFIIARHYNFEEKNISYSKLTVSVKNGLQRLFYLGCITRHHNPSDNAVGLWSLSKKD